MIFVLSGSVALLADLIHNVGDALTAIPIGIAFLLRSARAEKIAGLVVVLAIFVSACVAAYAAIQRLIHPQDSRTCGRSRSPGSRVRRQRDRRPGPTAGGQRLASPALVADGKHARADGFVSLGVVVSAVAVALGAEIVDPIVGLVITAVILRITWDSWRVIRASEPGEHLHEHRREPFL